MIAAPEMSRFVDQRTGLCARYSLDRTRVEGLCRRFAPAHRITPAATESASVFTTDNWFGIEITTLAGDDRGAIVFECLPEDNSAAVHLALRTHGSRTEAAFNLGCCVAWETGLRCIWFFFSESNRAALALAERLKLLHNAKLLDLDDPRMGGKTWVGKIVPPEKGEL